MWLGLEGLSGLIGHGLDGHGVDTWLAEHPVGMHVGRMMNRDRARQGIGATVEQ